MQAEKYVAPLSKYVSVAAAPDNGFSASYEG